MNLVQEKKNKKKTKRFFLKIDFFYFYKRHTHTTNFCFFYLLHSIKYMIILINNARLVVFIQIYYFIKQN